MYSHRTQLLALAMLLLSSLAALVLAAVVAAGMSLTPVVALCALSLSVLLFAGVVVLHNALREARWDAGYRLR